MQSVKCKAEKWVVCASVFVRSYGILGFCCWYGLARRRQASRCRWRHSDILPTWEVPK